MIPDDGVNGFGSLPVSPYLHLPRSPRSNFDRLAFNGNPQQIQLSAAQTCPTNRHAAKTALRFFLRYR